MGRIVYHRMDLTKRFHRITGDSVGIECDGVMLMSQKRTGRKKVADSRGRTRQSRRINDSHIASAEKSYEGTSQHETERR